MKKLIQFFFLISALVISLKNILSITEYAVFKNKMVLTSSFFCENKTFNFLLYLFFKF